MASLRCSSTATCDEAGLPCGVAACKVPSSACGTGPMRADTESSYHCACPLANARYRFTFPFIDHCLITCVHAAALRVHKTTPEVHLPKRCTGAASGAFCCSCCCCVVCCFFA